MHLARPHRTKSVAAVLAVVLVPMASTSSAPTAPAVQTETPAAGAPVLGAFPAMLERLDPETFLAESGARGEHGAVAVSSPKGTRVWTVSELSDHGLPVAAKKAYRRAADQMTRTDPGCRLPWTLLAGIGRVESDHGRYGGARLGHDGVSRPRIIGVQLDGAGPVAAIRDTDDGRLDGDRVWDRAVGPMQFIPSTWALSARDGDGDGRRSPHDLDDAATAAAAYLCSGSGSLTDPATQAAAIYRYNHDDYYVALVQAFEVGYRTGVFVLPSPPADEATTKRRNRRHDGAKPVKARTSTATRPAAGTSTRTTTKTTKTSTTKTTKTSTTKTGTSKPAPTPTPTKTTSPTPKPSPTPAPPAPTEMKGVLSECAGGYCLAGKPLDLGIVGQLGATAVGDFDGDGAVKTNGEELAGMLDKQVTMVVVKLDSGKLGIYSINGISLG